MIQITYKPSASPDSQMFLNELASALDPLDEVRKKEMEEAEKEYLPGMGGAIDDVINMATSPVTWQIVASVTQIIAALFPIYLASLSNKASKRLEFNIDNCKKVDINFNNYTNSSDLETDLKKKLKK